MLLATDTYCHRGRATGSCTKPTQTQCRARLLTLPRPGMEGLVVVRRKPAGATISPVSNTEESFAAVLVCLSSVTFGLCALLLLTHLNFPHCCTVGVCGDPWQAVPASSSADLLSYHVNRPTSAQATYRPGDRVSFQWRVTANHGGRFGFKLCNRNTNLDQACFDANVLQR